jgi:hypothetical protein
MSHDEAPAYGLWLLVILNSLVFTIFAFSFSKPQSRHHVRLPAQWLTVLALLMFPLLIAIYVRLARGGRGPTHLRCHIRRLCGDHAGWLPRLGSPARRQAGRWTDNGSKRRHRNVRAPLLSTEPHSAVLARVRTPRSGSRSRRSVGGLSGQA